MDYIKDLFAKIKAWFIGVADQDGDGDLDKEDAKIVAKKAKTAVKKTATKAKTCLLYTSPSPRDLSTARMPSSA